MLFPLFMLLSAPPADLAVRTVDSYTESEIYSEPHSAAAAAISTQNFIVGRMARDCTSVLSKPASYAKDREQAWQERNREYVDSATMFAANTLSYAKRIGGPDAEKKVYEAFITSVQSNGIAAVNDQMHGAPTKLEACSRFEAAVDAGKFDVTPSHPFYKELNEIVQIMRTFSK